jgi:exodeoxyribonuclease III
VDLLKFDLGAAGPADLSLITGDFNEPSFRDWSVEAAAAGVHPMAVDWPFTRAFGDLGFVDVFRQQHPDPLLKPGFTWSPQITADTLSDDRDRIDFIFARGVGIEIESAHIVDEPGPWSDIVIDRFPSDRRAVIATITLQEVQTP